MQQNNSQKQPVESVVPAMTTSVNHPNRATQPPRLSRKRRLAVLGFIFVLLCGTAGFFGARLAINDAVKTVTSPASQSKDAKNDGNAIITQSEQDITTVVDKVSPSVVSIVTDQQTSAGDAQSAGTGIIISSDGYILTNHHVVGSANVAQVVLSDGTAYKSVKVIGSDPLNDLAFLKVSGAKNLTPASIGNSATLRVGQQLVAIGNALGQYQNTVSSGILSGTGRPVSASDGDTTENLSDLLQTDAAINPGNSGGPLLNIAGQVIGINTAVAQDAQGIGFAIPIDAAKGEIASVIAGKGVRRAYIGVSYVAITPDVAQQYNLSVKQGAYVHAQNGSPIVSGGPGEQAGIQNKDIITAVNGTEIGSAGSLSTLIGQYQPGDTVQLSVLRGGKTLTIDVKLARYQGDSAVSQNSYQQNDQSKSQQQQQLPSIFNQLFGQ